MSPTPVEEATVTKFLHVVQRIEELKDEYGLLGVEGVTDTEGIKAVGKARREVVKHRTAIDARRKELKEPVLAQGRAIDAVAKELIARLAPLEAHLKHEEDTVQRELARIAKEKTDERMALLKAVGSREHRLSVERLDDGAFKVLLEQETQADKDRRDAAQLAEEEKVRLEREQAALAEERRKFEEEKARAAPPPLPPVAAYPAPVDPEYEEDPFTVVVPPKATQPDWRALLEAVVHRCDLEGVQGWAPIEDARKALEAAHMNACAGCDRPVYKGRLCGACRENER